MTNQRILFPDPAVKIGVHQVMSSKGYDGLTFSVNPQERTGQHPVLEYHALKEPPGSSLRFDLARSVVICGRIRRRKPFLNVLFYL
jgi:hypothetical protein